MTTRTAKTAKNAKITLYFYKIGGFDANVPRTFLKNSEMSGPLYLCLKKQTFLNRRFLV